MSAPIQLQDLSLGYGGRAVVDRLSGTFAAGRATAIVGPNGAGKSTLLKGLAGLIRPLAGRITGADPSHVAYLPQEPAVDRAFPIEVADFVALGFERRLGLFRAMGEAEQRDLARALAAVGLAGLERTPIGALSGGQFQRALFARVIAEDARVILLDEPFSSQDAATASALKTLIAGWVAEGRTLLLVLHDIAAARALCAEALVLAGHALAWGPAPEVLTPEVLGRADAVELAL